LSLDCDVDHEGRIDVNSFGKAGRVGVALRLPSH